MANFKLTTLKSIISIFGGLVLGYVWFMNAINYYSPNPIALYAGVSIVGLIFVYTAPIILIYIIWSHFQKK